MTLRMYRALLDRFKAAERRADARAGMICCILANINRDPQKRREPFTIEDFIGGPRSSATSGLTTKDYIEAMREQHGPNWKTAAPRGFDTMLKRFTNGR